MKNIRWKVFTVIGVFAVFFTLGVYPILANRYSLPAPGWLKAKQLKLGLDLKGGVHLVLRVHTDEALKTSTTTTGEQLREAARAAGINVTALTVPSPTTFRVEGVPSDKDAEFRRLADEHRRHQLRPQSADAGGAYDFTLRPNIARADAPADGDAGARDHRSPGQRAGRDRAQHLRVRRLRRSAAGAAAGRVRRRRAPRKSSARPRSCS